MALEACPRCTRPVSPLAHFCVHCRATIARPAGALLNREPIDWAGEMRQLIGTAHNSLHKLKEYGPSTQILFWLLAVSLMWFFGAVLPGPVAITNLAFALLLCGFMASPALLAFVLLLRRRSFGLYGALAVFVSWFSSSAGLLYLLHEHESPSVLLMSTIIAFISGWGTITAFHEAAGGNVIMRLLAFVTFFSLEVGIVWVFFYFSSS